MTKIVSDDFLTHDTRKCINIKEKIKLKMNRRNKSRLNWKLISLSKPPIKRNTIAPVMVGMLKRFE